MLSGMIELTLRPNLLCTFDEQTCSLEDYRLGKKRSAAFY